MAQPDAVRVPMLLRWPALLVTFGLTLVTNSGGSIGLFGLLFAYDRLSGVLMPAMIAVGAFDLLLFFPGVVALFLCRRPGARRFVLVMQWLQLATGGVFWALWFVADTVCGLSFTCV